MENLLLFLAILLRKGGGRGSSLEHFSHSELFSGRAN